MEIKFDKKYLSELHYNGCCSDKKHRYQPDIAKRYQRCINLMENVPMIESLYQYHALNYEILTDDKTTLKGKSDLPGVLLAGSILANGNQDTSFGAKAKDAIYISTGVYRINHCIGHTEYYVNVSVQGAQGIAGVAEKQSDYFTVNIRSFTGVLTNLPFDYSVFGEN